MKFSKKVLIPVILIVLICCIFAGITIKNSKYPLPNIKSSEIKAMSIYHKGTSTFRTVQNSDGKKLLKYVKNIIKKGDFSKQDGEFIYEDFTSSMSSKNEDNYYIEIPFSRTKELNLNGNTIKCDAIVIDVNENIFYYHTSDSYTLKVIKVSNANFNNLQKFLSSSY